MTIASPRTRDIAGTAWPLYKLEALVVGLFMFVATLAVSSSLQDGVLTAAASTVLVWWSLRTAEQSARQAR